VQTQVCYLAGFHDEPKAKWVAAFGEPSVTLDVERVSDKSVQPRYHGLDAFCEESGTPDAVDYFSAMIRAATVRYSVRYEVGTVDDGRGSAADAAPEGLAGATSGAADMLGSACQFSDASLAPKYTASKAAGGSSAPSWMAGGVGAAAASRRRNPFLPVWKPNLQPDFNVRVFECFDTSSLTGLRELDESDRSVQKSAESTSI